MPRPLQFVVGILVSALCSVILLFNVGAAGGGMVIINVAGHEALTTSYYVAGGGLFVTTLIVLTWRRNVRQKAGFAQTPHGAGSSRTLLRLAIVWLVLFPLWLIVGGMVIRSQVKLFKVDGDRQMLDKKVVETERATGGFRLYRLDPSGDGDYTLVVKKGRVDEVRRALEAEGAVLHSTGW